MPAGYSPNPLIKKLGIKEGFKCLILNEPANYVDLLEEIPPSSDFTDEAERGPFDFIHIFVTDASEVDMGFELWKAALKKTGMLWLSWPKQSSELATELNGNVVREIGLKGGLVDTKVCAVDHDWSGLKFMWRKEDR